MDYFEAKNRYLTLMKKSLSAASKGDLPTTLQHIGQIERLAREAAKSSVDSQNSLEMRQLRELAGEADSFLTRQAQAVKDAGNLELALVLHAACERIRRDAREEQSLMLNLSIQARLLTRASRPAEAVEKATEALALAKKINFYAVQSEMKRIIESEGKRPSYGLFGE